MKLCEVSMGMSEDEAKRLLKDKYPEPKKRKPKDGKHKNKSKPVHRPGRMNKTGTAADDIPF